MGGPICDEKNGFARSLVVAAGIGRGGFGEGGFGDVLGWGIGSVEAETAGRIWRGMLVR